MFKGEGAPEPERGEEDIKATYGERGRRTLEAEKAKLEAEIQDIDRHIAALKDIRLELNPEQPSDKKKDSICIQRIIELCNRRAVLVGQLNMINDDTARTERPGAVVVPTPEAGRPIGPESARETAEKSKGNKGLSKTLVAAAALALAAVIGVSSIIGGKDRGEKTTSNNPVSSEATMAPNTTATPEDDNRYAGELENGTTYDYTHYADRDHKEAYNAYDYDYSECYDDREKTIDGIMEVASRTPEALASYSYNIFTDEEKARLGIDGMNMTEIDDFMSNEEGGGELQQTLLNEFEKILRSERTKYNFYIENDTEKTNYIYWYDENYDSKMTPDELHLGYDERMRNGALQVDIIREFYDHSDKEGDYYNEKKMLDLNLNCGFQPNYEIPPEGVPYIPADPIPEETTTEHETTPEETTTEHETTPEETTTIVPTTTPEETTPTPTTTPEETTPTPTTTPEETTPTPTTTPEETTPTPTTTPEETTPTPTTTPEETTPTPTTPPPTTPEETTPTTTHAPKNTDAESEHAGPIVTPETTGRRTTPEEESEQESLNREEAEEQRRRDEEAARRAEEERERQRAAEEAARRALEEQERLRREEEERAIREAEEAASRAAEEAARQQSEAAERERQEREAAEEAARQQSEADSRAAEQTEPSTEQDAGERGGIFEGGDW